MRGIKISNINGMKNQFEVFIPDIGRIFQSYNSVIAIKDPKGNVTLDTDTWNYSKTTSKYRNIFLGETTKETGAKVISGEYKLENLN